MCDQVYLLAFVEEQESEDVFAVYESEEDARAAENAWNSWAAERPQAGAWIAHTKEERAAWRAWRSNCPIEDAEGYDYATVRAVPFHKAF